MLLCIACFAVGSALAGAAQNMPSKVICTRFPSDLKQPAGIGGGGILALTEVLVADLVPLAERGMYQGMIGIAWSFASMRYRASGANIPLDLNLPCTAITFFLVWRYHSVRTPEGKIISKLGKVDWIGNTIVVLGSGLCIIGMSWGGIRYPWHSAQAWHCWCRLAFTKPRLRDGLRFPLMRTSLSGLLTTAMHGIISILFFQACLGASPLRSGIDLLPGALVIAPMALVGGALVSFTKRYRPDSPMRNWMGYQIITGTGIGLIFTAPVFPLSSPLPIDRAASALAFFIFTRSFFRTWGITISWTILQNMLRRKLPADFVAQFPPGFEIAYAAIPAIKQLEEPIRTEVRAAFA
ncbi:hypothetical protein FB45DRAFT_863506 [Roridomyces roridus]|uniref:Uncharacterized protein n=1 Tax=Roridomyces roridus TaxID=1738132 RepID=A0AAD7C3Z6_9AGAR|nr:hypothetical protein FB45DRAFT_863506 [Roridomyces roridus]